MTITKSAKCFVLLFGMLVSSVAIAQYPSTLNCPGSGTFCDPPSNRWSVLSGKVIDAGSGSALEVYQFPQIPVIYCTSLSALGSAVPPSGTWSDAGITLEMVQADLTGAINEWFHGGGDIRPFLAGSDPAACKDGVTPGTILINTSWFDAGGDAPLTDSPVQTSLTVDDAGDILAATINIYEGETTCSGGVCTAQKYFYANGWDAGGFDLWSVALTGLGEALGFCDLDAGLSGICGPASFNWDAGFGGSKFADPQSVVNTGSWTPPGGSSTVSSWSVPRRHLLEDDYVNLQWLYPAVNWSGLQNTGWMSTDAGLGGLPYANSQQYKYAFHDTALGGASGIDNMVAAPSEPYGGTEPTLDQPAVCFQPNVKSLGGKLPSLGYRIFVALAGFDWTTQLEWSTQYGGGTFDGTEIVTYTTDGNGNASLRNIVPSTHAFKSPAVACTTTGYVLAYVDQLTHLISVLYSSDAKTWTTSSVSSMRTYETPALALDPSAGRVVLAFADAANNGKLTVAVSSSGTGATFGSPSAITSPATFYTDFIPGFGCEPNGSCLFALGPGSQPDQSFDNTNLTVMNASVSGATLTASGNSTYTYYDFLPQGAYVGASDGGFLIESTEPYNFFTGAYQAPQTDQAPFYYWTTSSTSTPNDFYGFSGSHGTAQSVLWEPVFQRWYMWGTGSFNYGN